MRRARKPSLETRAALPSHPKLPRRAAVCSASRRVRKFNTRHTISLENRTIWTGPSIPWKLVGWYSSFRCESIYLMSWVWIYERGHGWRPMLLAENEKSSFVLEFLKIPSIFKKDSRGSFDFTLVEYFFYPAVYHCHYYLLGIFYERVCVMLRVISYSVWVLVLF